MHKINNSSIAIWLIPEGYIFTKLSKIIKLFSKRYNTPYFLPHVTILSDIVMPEKKVKEICYQIVNKISPPIIILKNIHCSGDFFKKIHCEIPINYTFKNIYDIFLQSFLGYIPKNYYYKPHLSLLYSNINLIKAFQIKRKILKENNSLKKGVCFVSHKIYIVRITPEIEKWKILNSISIL